MENTELIELKCKQQESIFATQNAEFLACYDTDDKQINYYTDLAMKIFEEFEIDGEFDVEGVRKNVATWFENKKRQIELFRKHPYWSEEAKAIVFLQTETRGVNYQSASRELVDMFSYVDAHYKDSFKSYTISAMVNIFDNMGNDQQAIITEEFVERFKRQCLNFQELPKQVKRSLVKGAKITKFVRKLFEFLECRNGDVIDATKTVDAGDDPRRRDSFEKHYAKFADCLSELTVEKITLASLHFNDFMTMSNGNSWSSCHYINSHNIFHDSDVSSYSGAYKQGCLSYALDEPSFILYTLPASYDGTEYYRCQKLTRMCCQYENGVLITGKCYPNNEDNLIARYRRIMQQIISGIEGFPNLWTFSRNTNRIQAFVQTADRAAHYTDYLRCSQKPTVSLCKNHSIDLDKPMTIGRTAWCVCCGKEIYDDHAEWLQCASHRKKKVCKCCGKRIVKGNMCHQIGEEYYCADCVFYCEYHKTYEPVSNKHGDVGGKVVCKSAWQRIQRTINYDNIGIKIECRDHYSVGEYVLMASHIDCEFGTNSIMSCVYPNKIVKITQVGRGDNPSYRLTLLDTAGRNWAWSENCFVGAITGVTDADIGKTIEQLIKERTVHES